MPVTFHLWPTVQGMKRTSTSHAIVRQIANRSLVCCCLLFSALCPVTFAEPPDRLTTPLGSAKLTPLRASRHPQIDTLSDEGAVAPAERISGLRIRFKPTPAQSAALERLLEDQQNAASPLYHAWLSP